MKSCKLDFRLSLRDWQTSYPQCQERRKTTAVLINHSEKGFECICRLFRGWWFAGYFIKENIRTRLAHVQQQNFQATSSSRMLLSRFEMLWWQMQIKCSTSIIKWLCLKQPATGLSAAVRATMDHKKLAWSCHWPTRPCIVCTLGQLYTRSLGLNQSFCHFNDRRPWTSTNIIAYSLRLFLIPACELSS